MSCKCLQLTAVPPIDLSQLSPRTSKTRKPSRSSSSNPVSNSKTKRSGTLPQTGNGSDSHVTLKSKSLDAKTQKTRQIAREIKLIVHKNPNEIASEIKRRVQQKESKEDTLVGLESHADAYVKLGHHRLSERSHAALNSFRGYDQYNAMSPRINSGQVSMWECLPEEVWLHILYFLPLNDLHSFMLTCHDFNRISHDRSLWRTVILTKKQLADDEIVKLGHLRPIRLSIIQCTGVKLNGDLVSNKGLREMFSACGPELVHLSTASCVMPPLSGEAMLHHAIVHCPRIQSLDLSWCNLSDRDVELVAENLPKVKELLLSGNQTITDNSMIKICERLANQLTQLEVQGCFKLTNRSLSEIGRCTFLEILNIAQCHKLSSSVIMTKVSRLSALRVCILKGLKQIKDDSIAQIVKSCPNIHHLVISGCTSLSPKSLIEISCALYALTSLEMSSCKDSVNDASVCALLANCGNLEKLDLSSTHVSNHCMTALASSRTRLTHLKLNFCSITDAGVKELLRHSPSLKNMQLYGVKGVQLSELSEINPHVAIDN